MLSLFNDSFNYSDCVISNDSDTCKEVQGTGSGLILNDFLNDSWQCTDDQLVHTAIRILL